MNAQVVRVFNTQRVLPLYYYFRTWKGVTVYIKYTNYSEQWDEWTYERISLYPDSDIFTKFTGTSGWDIESFYEEYGESPLVEITEELWNYQLLLTYGFV